MHILITNDDGLNAKGLKALKKFLMDREGVKVSLVAPKRNMSATSHSVTLDKQIVVEDHGIPDGVRTFVVDGTPSDCIKIAISQLRIKPDLIISGINEGANTGVSVFYSGTIAAAREGVINGIPAIAISVCKKDYHQFEGSCFVLEQFLNSMDVHGFEKSLFVNISVPAIESDEIKGIRLAHQAPSKFVEEFIPIEPTAEDSDLNRSRFQMAGHIDVQPSEGVSDEELIREGWAAITPFQIDCTDYKMLSFLKERLEN